MDLGEVTQGGSKGNGGELLAARALLHDGRDQEEQGKGGTVSLDDRNSQTSPRSVVQRPGPQQAQDQNQMARGSNEVGGPDSPDLPASFHDPNVLPSWEEIDEQEDRVRRWVNQQSGSEGEPSPTTPESSLPPPELEVPFEVWDHQVWQGLSSNPSLWPSTSCSCPSINVVWKLQKADE